MDPPYIILMIFLIKYLAAAALPPPLAAITAAANFNIGDLVRTIPDTTPGVHPSHSVAVYGRVVLVESQADGFWYKVQSSYTITRLIPENRVVAQSKAIFDNAIIDTRATSSDAAIKLKRRLVAKDIVIGKKDAKIKMLETRLEIAEESIAEYRELKRECKQLEKEIKVRKESNATLLQMSRDKEVDNALAIFSRTGPSASASIVSHQLRDLFLGKISEEKSRTEEVIGLMGDLESQIDSLTAELRTEVGKNIVISFHPFIDGISLVSLRILNYT